MQRAWHWVPRSDNGSVKPVGRLKGTVRKEGVGRGEGTTQVRARKPWSVCGGERTPSD